MKDVGTQALEVDGLGFKDGAEALERLQEMAHAIAVSLPGES